MPVATEPRPAQLPLPGGRHEASVRVHPILTGELRAPSVHTDRPSGLLAAPRILAQLLGPRGGWNWLPVPAFLVEHPGAGRLLIDTGLHPSCATDVGGNMGRVGRLLYSVRMRQDQALRSQLPARGVRPEDVGVVILTHLHIDHASAVSEFPKATFVVDRREWVAAAHGGARHGYYTRQFDHAFDWRTVDYGEETVGSFSAFGRSLDVFGDGSVRLLSTPGHTAGHQSVLLRTGGDPVLVVGDAAYTERELDGLATPLVVHDEHLRSRSLAEIRNHLRQAPDTVVIISHDASAWRMLKPLYE